MQHLLTYIIKLSFALAVVYAFYALFLRRLTFYNWNRWYLVGYSLLAFVIPFVDITPVLQQHALEGEEVVNYIPVMDYRNLLQPSEPAHWTLQQAILTGIALGMGVLLVRLLLQHVSLYRLRRKAQLLLDDTVKLYQVDAPIMPFSYGNAIYVNAAQHNEEELREIIRHEFVHVKQQHTVDMLWSELLCIVNWYNPFAWLIRKAIRQNLEFIADRQVLQHGMDKKAYQYLLLKVIGVRQYSFAAPFNFTSLKNRIAMMNKMRSAKTQLLKFLFLIPLLVVLLLAFRNATAGGEKIKGMSENNTENLIWDTVPRPAKPRLPEGVKNISVANDVVTVTRKDGAQEKYNVNNATEMAAYKKKYGELPPPPPPPLAPKAPKLPKAPKASQEGVNAPEPPVPPTPPAVPDAEDWARSTPPQTPNAKGYILSVADNNGECIVIIKNKAGKIEKSMLLTDWTGNEKGNEAKYGSIPPPPPPRADKYGVKEPGKLPAPGGDATIIVAPKEGDYMMKADKLELKQQSGNKPIISNITIKGQTPLFVVDGVIRKDLQVSALDPMNIAEMSVLKEQSATALYGEDGKNGVVIIKTKPFSTQSDKVNNVAKKNDAKAQEPLYIINGKEYDKTGFESLNIDPNTIASVNVLKGENAEKKYGAKGKNGVVEVNLK